MKPALLAWLLVAGGERLAYAQLDLETSVPTNWSATLGSLAISPNHYKLGAQSLQWNWVPGDSLVVTNPGIAAADVTDFYKHTCDLWVHSPGNLTGQKLQFQFLDPAGTVQYYFDFLLNFNGWRRAVRSYMYDMKGTKASASFDRVRIIAPTNGTAGELFFDAVRWVGPRFGRVKDAPNPDIAGYLSDSSSWRYWAELQPDIPATTPTAGELGDLATLRSRWLAAHAGSAPSASALASARANWTNLNLAVNGSDICGKVITDDTSALETWTLTLAQDVHWRTNAESVGQFNLFLRHWVDQGMDAGSGAFGTGGSGGYDFRNTPRSFVLASPVYSAGLKEQVWKMLHWGYQFGEYWETNWAPGGNTDDIYLNLRQQLGAIALLTTNDAEAVQYLKGCQRYLERFLTPAHGTSDGIKVDGLGFHHGTHYNAYMYALRELSDNLHYLRGTGFQVNSNAYFNLRNAFLAMLRMANSVPGSSSPGYTGNALSGRHPLSTSLPFDHTTLQRLGEWGGAVLGLPADPVVAQAYNRLFASNYPHAPFSSHGPEPNPAGFYSYNYGPLGIYRQSNWVASIHGMGDDFWGSEIYATENRYGRYQSYGVCEVLYPGGNSASGFSLTGWDWNKPPGSTTIVLPWAMLEAESDREDVKSALNFSGGLAFRDGSGLYACSFKERNAGTNHNPTFAWRKSWFCFSDQIVCLGSDINNNDALHPTVTTLFQGRLNNTTMATWLNGAAITDFPHEQTDTSSSNRWFLDAQGTGYLVAPGSLLRLSRSLQTSPDETGSGATSSTHYATAWLDHGPAPAGARYEYVIRPSTTAAAMAQLAASPPSYDALQQDAAAHVVRWRADQRIGYALFATNTVAGAAADAGPLRRATLPCLAMSQLSPGGTLWLTVVNPDLNLVNNVSMPITLDLTLDGQWNALSLPTNATVLTASASATTLRLTTLHGLPVDLQFQTNQPPALAGPPNRTIALNTSTGPLPLTVSDDATPPGSVTLIADSSNPALVPNTNLLLGGAGQNRTIAVTPRAGAAGMTQITVSASDGRAAGTASFLVTVFDPADVRLTVSRSGSQLALAWPGHVGDWIPEGTTNLASPVIWTPVTGLPALVNGQWHLTVPSNEDASGFFRLRVAVP